jgi:hypothetical protein
MLFYFLTLISKSFPTIFQCKKLSNVFRRALEEIVLDFLKTVVEQVWEQNKNGSLREIFLFSFLGN